ncbi:SurA N-terminal domain-containing protein [Nonomuraea longicatena]|uniref:SurA N-terminal domain-containing protein n=1 Tax=Nonomuraea longicatena TaxID=83682 RepID=A0ABN1QBW6_9ACTN
MHVKSIRVALAALAAGAALTACSSPMKAGAAAVVGGERIAAKDLDEKVTEYEKALTMAKLDASALQVPLNQFVLYRLTNESVYRQLAAKHRVAVSEAEIDVALKDPGQQQSPQMNLLAKGVAPGNARDYLRAEIGMSKLLEQLGGGQNQQAVEQLRKEFTTIKVSYSPRYGQINPQPSQENPSMFVDTGRFGKLTPTAQG